MKEAFAKRGGLPGQLVEEAYGLELLRPAAQAAGLDVPAVHSVNEELLVLERVAASRPSPAHWTRLGRGLAALHAQRHARYGLDRDNTIGRNPQRNGWSGQWGPFFVRQRLQAQVGLVRDERRRRAYGERLAACAPRVEEYLSARCPYPSLLHGDLWVGNVLFSEDGRAWLIDPAVYYGDAEADVAMTGMFGGFAPEFLAAYRALRPAPPDAALRGRVYNFYHALNHYNLFGAAYLDACEDGFDALESV